MQKSPKDWNFKVKSAPGTRLPSGGIYPPYGHIGHWEVTGKITEEMGFSAQSVDILCDAAQDPDFYDFETVPAGRPQRQGVQGGEQRPEGSQEGCDRLVRERKRAYDLCARELQSPEGRRQGCLVHEFRLREGNGMGKFSGESLSSRAIRCPCCR